MKNLRAVAPVFIALVLASASSAQEIESPIAGNLPSVAAAHCQYTPDDQECLYLRSPGRSPEQAQMPPRIPAPPRRPQRPPFSSGAGHPLMWVPTPNAGHAAIGFLIGFTLGAVHPNDTTVRGHVALGLIAGLMGAVIGAGVPSFHWRSSRPQHPWPDEDDEVACGCKAPKSDSLKPASSDRPPAHRATASTLCSTSSMASQFSAKKEASLPSAASE